MNPTAIPDSEQDLDATIEDVIRSMDWDLDSHKREDLTELCQRLAKRLQGAPGQESESASKFKPPHFNDWLLSLPAGRRDVIKDDKWMLADFSFRSGFDLGVNAKHPPLARSQPVAIMRAALEALAVSEMGEPSLFAGEYERQTKETARDALAKLQAFYVGEVLGLCPDCAEDGSCHGRQQHCAAGAMAKSQQGSTEDLPPDIAELVKAMLELDPYDPHQPLTSRQQFCAALARAGFRRQHEGEQTLRNLIERNVRYEEGRGVLDAAKLGNELATLLGLNVEASDSSR